MTKGERRPFREFGSWLRARRLSRRWTQEELADRLGYDVTYVRKIEWGERKATEGFRARLAVVFELPVDSLPESEGGVERTGALPVPLTSFIGRQQEVAAVTDLLVREARLVTLLGAPGIGKTRLALEVATRLDDRFEHGSRFVSLITVTEAEAVPTAVCAGLGIRGGRPEAAEKALADYLSGQELLLVLDNFEHLVGAAPLAGRLLARAPSLRVLVTSREALRVTGEVQYPVPPLPVGGIGPDAPAVSLFLQRARLVRPEFTLGDDSLDDVVAVCQRLDGVPLAIELAAAAARLLTPRELRASLDQVLDLPATGPRDAPVHQQTLRAAIGWSYQLLGPDHQALLARLGIFVGGFTLAAASAVCADAALDETRVVAGVAALVSKSLVESRSDSPTSRFALLEAIREYALERLAERRETEEVARRHARWCLELAELAEPQLTAKEQGRWLDVLSVEHPNLTAALRWTLERQPADGLRLGGALWRFWWMRGHFGEGRQWLEEALSKAAGPAHDRWRIRAATGAAVLARTQGDYQRAQELCEEAAALARRAGRDEDVALALLNLGIVRQHQGHYDEAHRLFEQSLALYRGVGSERGAGHALNCLGTVSVFHGDEISARALFDQALASFRSVEDRWSVALASANLGWVAHTAGDTAAARSWYAHSLTVSRALGDERGAANALTNLGRVAFRDGDLPAATGFLEEGLLLLRRLGERRAVAECLEQLGAVAAARAQPERAARLHAAAAVLRETIGAPVWPAEQEAQASVLDAVRRQLTAEAFDEAWADGRLMTTDEAVLFALART